MFFNDPAPYRAKIFFPGITDPSQANMPVAAKENKVPLGRILLKHSVHESIPVSIFSIIFSPAGHPVFRSIHEH